MADICYLSYLSFNYMSTSKVRVAKQTTVGLINEQSEKI